MAARAGGRTATAGQPLDRIPPLIAHGWASRFVSLPTARLCTAERACAPMAMLRSRFATGRFLHKEHRYVTAPGRSCFFGLFSRIGNGSHETDCFVGLRSGARRREHGRSAAAPPLELCDVHAAGRNGADDGQRAGDAPQRNSAQERRMRKRRMTKATRRRLRPQPPSRRCRTARPRLKASPISWPPTTAWATGAETPAMKAAAAEQRRRLRMPSAATRTAAWPPSMWAMPKPPTACGFAAGGIARDSADSQRSSSKSCRERGACLSAGR